MRGEIHFGNYQLRWLPNQIQGENGVVLPNLQYATAYRVLAPTVWPQLKEIFETVVAGGLIQLPSSAKDFSNPELRPYLDQYYKGTGVDAVERVKLMKMIWDSIGTEFGGRNELYEINYAGNQDNIRLETLRMADISGQSAKYKSFVDEAMSDYDLDGWTNDTWVNAHKTIR